MCGYDNFGAGTEKYNVLSTITWKHWTQSNTTLTVCLRPRQRRPDTRQQEEEEADAGHPKTHHASAGVWKRRGGGGGGVGGWKGRAVWQSGGSARFRPPPASTAPSYHGF